VAGLDRLSFSSFMPADTAVASPIAKNASQGSDCAVSAALSDTKVIAWNRPARLCNLVMVSRKVGFSSL
jgi:hypothetical protein